MEIKTNMVWNGHRVIEASCPGGGKMRWAACADIKDKPKDKPGSLDLPENARVEIDGNITCKYCKSLG